MQRKPLVKYTGRERDATNQLKGMGQTSRVNSSIPRQQQQFWAPKGNKGRCWLTTRAVRAGELTGSRTLPFSAKRVLESQNAVVKE